MPNTDISAPPGFYTSLALTNIASTHFPDAYNALIAPSELAWETVNFPGYYQSVLFVGYISLAGSQHKVLACMSAADGAIGFCTRNGMSLSRADKGKVQLVAPWSFVGEIGVLRPQLVNLVTLLQFFFAVGGVGMGVLVKKGWFRKLQVACGLVGQGMAMAYGRENFLDGGGVCGDIDAGYEGGDEGDVAPGMRVKKSARIVQRLLAVARRTNWHWTKHVESELKSAWPGLKKHWKK